MLLGGFVADAAAMPLHWVYDTAKIARLVGTGVPEFFSPPQNAFYTQPLGENTPYGQQWRSAHLPTGAGNASFPPTVIEQLYFNTYQPGGVATKNSWYFDESTKEFVANEEAGRKWPQCGGNDNQADAIVHAMPVVAAWAGIDEPTMLRLADAAIRVTQATDEAAAFGLATARLLSKLIASDMSGYEAVVSTIADLRNASRLQPYAQDAALADGLEKVVTPPLLNETNLQVCLALGQSCDYPFNLWTGAHLIAQLGAGASDYVSGVRQTILAGGDSGSRGFFVGGAQAARMGDATLIPSEWVASATAYPVVAPLVGALVAQRKQARASVGGSQA